MTIELDETTARNLQAAAQLVQDLQTNPATRRSFLGLFKQAKPTTSIPEIDAAKPLEDKIENLVKTVDELKVSLTQRDQDTSLSDARKELVTKYSYTPEGIKELEKFMLETNTADHMVAHDALQARKPKASPMRPAFEVKGFFDQDDQDDAAWVANPDRALDRELNKAFEAIANGLA